MPGRVPTLPRRTIWESDMVAAVRVHKNGGPEVLTYEDIEIPAPGPGQVGNANASEAGARPASLCQMW